MVRIRRRDEEIVPASPFALIDEMDRLFESLRNSLWGYEPGEVTVENARVPAMDIVDRGDHLEITAELPGVDKNDVELEVTEDSISIKAERKEEKEEKGANYYRRERGYAVFQRALGLPVPVNPDKAEAELKNGVLRVVLPKKEISERGGRRIQVK